MSVKRARARTHHQTLATRVTIVNDDDALTRPAHAQCSSEADTQQMHHTQHSHIAKCSEITRFILFLNTFLISILRILCGSRHVTLGRPKLLCRRSFGLFLAWQQRNKKIKHLKLWRWKWTVLEMSTNQPATQTVEAYCKEQAKLSDPYLDIQSIEPFFYFHSLSIWWWRGKKNIQKSCWSEPIDISVLLVLFFWAHWVTKFMHIQYSAAHDDRADCERVNFYVRDINVADVGRCVIK